MVTSARQRRASQVDSMEGAVKKTLLVVLLSLTVILALPLGAFAGVNPVLPGGGWWTGSPPPNEGTRTGTRRPAPRHPAAPRPSHRSHPHPPNGEKRLLHQDHDLLRPERRRLSSDGHGLVPLWRNDLHLHHPLDRSGRNGFVHCGRLARCRDEPAALWSVGPGFAVRHIDDRHGGRRDR